MDNFYIVENYKNCVFIMTDESEYHGMVLTFPSINEDMSDFMDKLPKRKDFIDKVLAKKDRDRITDKKYIIMMPNDIQEVQTKEMQDSGYESMVSKLIVYGVIRSGEKVAVILDNLEIFFDLMIPENVDEIAFYEQVEGILKEEKAYFSRMKIVKRRPFTEYLEEDRTFLRIFFKRTNYRTNAIRYFVNNQITYHDEKGEKYKEYIKTFANDTSCHYRKVCRENNFTLGDWNTMENYKVVKKSSLVNYNKIDLAFQLDVKDFKDASLKIKNKTESMLKDKTMVSCWDLETFDTFPTGNVPLPEHVFDDDENERSLMFMDATTFGWNYSTKPFLKVCISDLPLPPNKGHLTIVCRSQTEILKTKAIIWGRMNPELIYGFNDGQYDWPFILNRIEQFDKYAKKNGEDLNLMEFFKTHLSCIPYTEADAKWTIKGPQVEDKIKVEADLSVRNEFFKAPGYISMDVRTVFRQLYPKVGKSGSLNAFLKICKLELKEDMGYKTMFQIKAISIYLCKIFKTHNYEKIKLNLLALEKKHGKDAQLFETIWKKYIEVDIKKPGHITQRFKINTWTLEFILSLVNQTTNVATYCVTDATRCQELMHKRNVIMDRRAISKRSYTSMFDCLYRAGGMKVRNLVQAEGCKPKWNLSFNTISLAEKDPRKYPGAYVVPPKKGLYRDHNIIKRYRRTASVNGDFVETDTGKRIKIDPNKVDPKNKHFDKKLLKCAVDVQHYLEKMSMTTIPNDENDKIDRPLTGLDFSSLYPNICTTYNLSKEKCIFTEKRMKEVLKKLKKKYPDKKDTDLIHHVKFYYGLEGQEDKDKELIEGWFVRHIPVYTEDPTTKKRTYTDYEGMGLYPYILLQLYKERSGVKKLADYWGIPLEFLEKFLKDNPKIYELSEEEQKELVKTAVTNNVKAREQDVANVAGTRKEKYFKGKLWVANTIATFFEKEYFSPDVNITLEKLEDNCTYYFAYFTANQLALKVFMNTFYGEAGNSMSAFFEVRVAGGITTWGQYNIRKMKEFVESKGYTVLYGDTDSLYITCPDKLFAAVDKLYLTGKISKTQYWTEMIEITMETIDSFKDEVNYQLMIDNGTPFLNMAYEEVLWPYALTGKKKYGGIPHMGIVNLKPCMRECPLDEFIKSLFIRGWEMKKRGCSEFAVLNSGIVLKEAFCIESTKTLKEIVEDEIAHIMETKWEPKVFIKSAKYKPAEGDKPGNKAVISFIERMKLIEQRKPQLGVKGRDPGERFDYVVIRRFPWSYDYMGRKQKVGQGDKYEYFESLTNEKYKEHIAEDLEIDMDYYMTGEIAGQFGRYLVYHPDYDKFFKDDMTDEEYKVADDKAVKYAKKMLTAFYNQRFKHEFEDKGAKYKILSREVGKAIIQQKKEKYGEAGSIFGLASSVLNRKDFNDNYSGAKQALKQKLVNEAKKLAKKGTAVEVRKIIAAQLKNKRTTPYSLYALYVSGKNPLNNLKKEYVRTMSSDANKKLNKLLDDYIESCKEENENLRDTINSLRKKVDKTKSDNILGEITTNINTLFDDTGDDKLKDKDKIVYELYEAYKSLVTVYKIQEETEVYKLELQKIKREKAGEVVVPHDFDNDICDDRWMNWLQDKDKLKGEIKINDEDA